jgi:hypothetical protein
MTPKAIVPKAIVMTPKANCAKSQLTPLHKRFSIVEEGGRRKLAQRVNAFLQRVDRAFHGWWAGCIGITLGIWLFYFAFKGLPWADLPNVFRFILSSWLILLIRGAIIYFGALNTATGRETPLKMLGWIAAGIAWKFLKFIIPVFIDLSDLLIIYGMAGLTTFCIQRSRTAPPSDPSGNVTGW